MKKLFLVSVLADYEFLGGGRSGEDVRGLFGLAIASNGEEATRLVLSGMKPLTRQPLDEGRYFNLSVVETKEISLNKAGYLGSMLADLRSSQGLPRF